MKQSFDFFVANPAGNITGFVVWPVYPGYRPAYTKAIMEQIDTTVEQVGFISPSYDGPPLRMDMAGGEFCGNATRSYGLYAAKFLDEGGEGYIEVYVSGVDHPMYVFVNTEENTAYVELPKAKNIGEITIEDSTYKVVELEGITHVIIDDRKEDKDFVDKALKAVKEKFQCEAYGILFYNEKEDKMVPYVNVVEADTLIRESSCGSGTVAMGYYLNTDEDENFKKIIRQPNGELEVRAGKDEEGHMVYSIGGPVELSEVRKVQIDIPAETVKKVKEDYLAHKKD
ncbi:hypothetical protein ING2D1G_0166 [Peptoniphilus sp. ING2-D1G]|nr:hypothetical protein ING2D1G_0166 [Peptoniphilus sp. ING2-D1G]